MNRTIITITIAVLTALPVTANAGGSGIGAITQISTLKQTNAKTSGLNAADKQRDLINKQRGTRAPQRPTQIRNLNHSLNQNMKQKAQ